ncbi:MAG: [FeFe] hydrogenase H-cluster radical SAM maturase HydE [Candidatus Eisenbacteria bacterium]|nr:[FeFe] hydrogenase H-cluster radical SAM maturase HydE [Candidatus Eisenbacteria bacterium]
MPGAHAELGRQEILLWLREEDPERLEILWDLADRVRREHVGDQVHLRGLIEFSNYCVRACAYCGIRAENRGLVRYRMSGDEIVAAAADAARLGYGTVVLQSGEDPFYDGPGIASIVRRIKEATGLAVTLSLGERSEQDLTLWRAAGADRYLLRFETSNRRLYDAIHPARRPGSESDRFRILRALRAIGYEVGSGVMVGIPGQTWEDLADDLLAFRDLDLDMIGVGPYVPHPDTPLASAAGAAGGVPHTPEATYRVIALARLLCPDANIPSTTALATLDPAEGRERGLRRGANVLMPNVTPMRYRRLYEIYPEKACLSETPSDARASELPTSGRSVEGRIRAIGRVVGAGPGGSANARKRSPQACAAPQASPRRPRRIP